MTGRAGSDPYQHGRSHDEPGRACPVLVATGDPSLAERLERLASASGVRLRVQGGLAQIPRSAPLVLIGADLAAGEVGEPAPPEVLPWRPGVLVVAAEPVGEQVWRLAMRYRAETVAVLPEAEPWLVGRLIEAAEPAAEAPVIGVVGGRGGAGASVLAAALALTAAATGPRPLLIDADPLGGGLDVMLGAEAEPGLRWPGLSSARGRLQPELLRSELVRVDGVDLLSWDGGDLPDVPAEAMAAVLSGAVRCADLVVVDLPRHLGEAATVAAAACRWVLVVVPAEVRATAAARRVVRALEPHVSDLRVVVRGPAPTGVPAEYVAETLELPLAGELRAEPGLAAALDRGEPPGLRSRGPLVRLSRRLLADLGPPVAPASRALAAGPALADIEPGTTRTEGTPGTRSPARHRAGRGAGGAA